MKRIRRQTEIEPLDLAVPGKHLADVLGCHPHSVTGRLKQAAMHIDTLASIAERFAKDGRPHAAATSITSAEKLVGSLVAAFPEEMLAAVRERIERRRRLDQ